MTITVHTISGAPRPWRVLLGLCFKGLKFETITLKASDGDHKSKSFLALNPRGTVPVMQDGEVIVRDSIAALAWLDRAYPDNPLFGSAADEAAQIWESTMELADYLRAAIDRLLTPIFFEGAVMTTPELLTSAYDAKVELAALETTLRRTPFLGGATPGASDAVAFPEVRLLQRASNTSPGIMAELGLADFYEQFPQIGAWVARIEALPGYAETIPQHWKETI